MVDESDITIHSHQNKDLLMGETLILKGKCTEIIKLSKEMQVMLFNNQRSFSFLELDFINTKWGIYYAKFIF